MAEVSDLVQAAPDFLTASKANEIGKVNYALIGDPGHQLAKAFDVLIEEGDDAGLCLHGTFVIDLQGHIKTIEVHPDGISPHVFKASRHA